MKKETIVIMTSLMFLLSACSNDLDNKEQSGHENMEHSQGGHGDSHGDGHQEDHEHSDDIFGEMDKNQSYELPDDVNEGASRNLQTLMTKNSTRLNTSEASAASILTSQMIWPSTHKNSQPGTVILIPENNWQIGLAAVDLIHHPNNGPVLYYNEKGIPENVMNEIKRLNPKGNVNKTQIMVMGDAPASVSKQLKGYAIQEVKGSSPEEFAAEIDQTYAGVTDNQYPESIIIVSSEEKAKPYSLLAANWIAHMPEPVLYVNDEGIPEETKKALEKRDGKANLYLLGAKDAATDEVAKKLKVYGDVTRIKGTDPVSMSVEFAKFKDKDTGFGWGLTDPGHGVSFISTSTPQLVIPAAPFSHLGKHAPLIWLENGKVNKPVVDFLGGIKPAFKESPQEGPYNHGIIVGDLEAIPYQTQGILDDALEIVPASGEAHGGH
ncbi:cell wall-binding repeat-containing protein [Bacillus sp. Marseille-Q1617]|uniref:cell wall-binding repeat-containing protein n=1 Tax=Bacillus sp. Marseille-Q1617 TaxID=2736887 RepID=UPI00158E70D1|nr:cell wall-binding repeat-containing protein [Bacillus sp. Marseille-Q1617]